MNGEAQTPVAAESPVETIRMLQDELALTNREVMALTMELETRLEQLSAAEERFRRLAENAPDTIYRYELRPAPGFTFVNTRASTITGYSIDEFYRDPDLWKKIVHPDDLPLIEPVLQGDRVNDEGIILRWIGKEGSLMWIEQHHNVVRDQSGQIVAVECIARDITERNKLEEMLRHSQKMEAMGRLAGGVAHDFNNLLTVILGYSNVLSDRLPADDPLRKPLDAIQRAGQQAASLTGQLLAYSRKQALQPRVLDLSALIGEINDMLERLIGEDVSLAVIQDGACHVKGDSGQLTQVVMNLVINARDAMPHGGKLTVEARCVLRESEDIGCHTFRASGRYVMLVVSDTGCGMTPEVQSHIFEPFYTTKEFGKGTGLGLATIYGIVQQHGGWIDVYSELDHGTTFKVYIPEASSETPATVPAASVTGTKRLATILVAEDQAAIRLLAEDVLSEAGHRVITAANGRAALELAQDHTGAIDLLVTDVVMPGMNGPELASHLNRACPGLLVLYTSGYTDHALLHGGVIETGTAFLQKPFLPQDLLAKVDELLTSSPPEPQSDPCS